MQTDPRDTLTDLFKKLPGVGPRQARRFVYALLSTAPTFRSELTEAISALDKQVAQCAGCARFFKRNNTEDFCDICSDANTDTTTILLVEKDVDFESIRKSNAYKGRYFVLGGTIPVLAEDPTKHIRARQLLEVVERANEKLQEIIIALSVNPEGDNTAQYVKKILEPLAERHQFKITILGRGLSTGTELEYSDADTLTHALSNRR